MGCQAVSGGHDPAMIQNRASAKVNPEYLQGRHVGMLVGLLYRIATDNWSG